MKSVGQLLIGILTAAGSGLLVLAAISLALVEGGVSRASTPPTASPTSVGATALPPASITLQPTQAQMKVQVITATQASSNCTQPVGWIKYTIQSGDDLNSIAGRVGLQAEDILKANCMVTSALLPGTFLYVPFMPTETAAPTDTSVPTKQACGAPSGWVVYTVQSGDTLSHLGQALGVSVAQLQQANCLSSVFIRTGMRLYVPFIPAYRPPAATATPVIQAQPSSTTAPLPTMSGGTLPAKPGKTETPTVEPPTATPEPPTATPETATVAPPTVEPTQQAVTPANTETPIPTKSPNK